MSQMTFSQARIIDPVLTQIAQGFKQQGFIGGSLFPQVTVSLRSNRLITFSKEDFVVQAAARAPGENTKRVQYTYSNSSYALVDYSLEGSLPIELQQEALAPEKGFSIDLATMTIQKTMAKLSLGLEVSQSTLVRNLSNYGANNKTTLSGTSQWSDFSGTSDPIKDVEAAKEAVRAAIGVRPNVMWMGAAVFAQLKQHPKVVDRIKYTSREVATPELLASLFGLERVLVGDAIQASDAGVFSDVWGKDAGLAYTNLAGIATYGEPTFGYTFNLGGYPLAEEAYYERNSKTWFFPVTRVEAPYIVGANGGFLWKNAVA